MEENKLIAEFMGTEWHKNIDLDFFKDVCIISSSNIPYKFHSSWDWLMPVIEKIQDIFVDNPELDWQLYDDIRLNVPYLDDTYNAVLYAIKQYNNQNN